MNVCVIGVGNIGMRYVQGITASFPDAKLYLVDSPARLVELEKLDLGNVSLCDSLDAVNGSIELFVVATSCEPRLSIYKQCIARNPRFIILEKYLFKSRDEFDESLQLAQVPTFVNQWMYGSGTFDCLFEKEARSVEVSGSGWGLSCNAVHWIDVMKRHLKIEGLRVGQGTSVTEVFASKRDGYEEIYGELVFEDVDSNKRFTLIDKYDEGLLNKMIITVDGRACEFDFSCIKENGKVLSQFPYFSSLIGGIVGDLMDSGQCHLPNLQESISQHLLIEDVLETLDRRPVIT
ncbi:MAG: hypothetical protein AB8G18_04695 [Gammaproteobacteria bacterium]